MFVCCVRGVRGKSSRSTAAAVDSVASVECSGGSVYMCVYVVLEASVVNHHGAQQRQWTVCSGGSVYVCVYVVLEASVVSHHGAQRRQWTVLLVSTVCTCVCMLC